jgi:RNA polymerase sigma factor (TIGR02999 family)
MTDTVDVTGLLHRWEAGDRAALDQLIPLVYRELRRLARHYLRQERTSHTLQPTALVHEAYLRLVDQRNAHWESRTQFFGVAAQIMRRILVDHARLHEAKKRRAFRDAISLDEALTLDSARNGDANLIALDDSLSALAAFDEQKCRVVELRYFVGLSVEDAAQVLGISPATVKRHWSVAKAWLSRDMKGRRHGSTAMEAGG